jgi:hypothetical protein
MSMEALLTHNEIQQLRDATKGCATLVHFNNAGASLPPDVVVDTAIEYLREEALNGGYEQKISTGINWQMFTLR